MDKYEVVIYQNDFYRVVERKKTCNEYIKLCATEIIGVQLTSNVYGRFMIDSLASSSIRQGRCPVRSLSNYDVNDSGLWFLTKHHRFDDDVNNFHTVINMEIGDVIWFEGRKFELIRMDDFNVGLKLLD